MSLLGGSEWFSLTPDEECALLRRQSLLLDDLHLLYFVGATRSAELQLRSLGGFADYGTRQRGVKWGAPHLVPRKKTAR